MLQSEDGPEYKNIKKQVPKAGERKKEESKTSHNAATIETILATILYVCKWQAFNRPAKRSNKTFIYACKFGLVRNSKRLFQAL